MSSRPNNKPSLHPQEICSLCDDSPNSSDSEKLITCPFCRGKGDAWELQFSPLPQPFGKNQIAAWLAHLPPPAFIELVATANGIKVRLRVSPEIGLSVTQTWAALTSQQSRWRHLEGQPGNWDEENSCVLFSSSQLPALAASEGDPFLTIGGQLLSMARSRRQGDVSIRIWFLGKETTIQDRLRALAAYNYGTETGVDAGTPNPWGLRLALLRVVLVFGGALSAFAGGALAAGWLPKPAGVLGLLAGAILFLAGYLGQLEWMRWRSLPKETVARAIEGTLLKVAFSLHWNAEAEGSINPDSLGLLSSASKWVPLEKAWPAIQSFGMPLPAADLAALIAPPEGGEGSGIIAREVRQDVPAPPPSPVLVNAPFKVGTAVATGELIGVNPDGHGLATGGSRTGKTSFVYRLLQQLVEQGDDAPGIFLVDPHASLADGFLHTIDLLPDGLREKAIARLRVITPDQPEVVPLNMLAIPEFAWAGNAIVQAGRRIWGDYWGPRMQAALLGLFKLAHAWNLRMPDKRMGLLHVVFAAFNTDWRNDALSFLPPAERLGSLALNALLGQLSGEGGSWSQKWATEVISPVLSKTMALELSPWLFAAMHQDRFVDMERWVREKAWIVLRLPTGEMGREGAKLTAGMVYNVFDAAFRKVAQNNPTPFYFIIDEAQEIAGGMQIEAMLSEGAKFGARMFVLAQSLSLMRRLEGFEPVVQSLLANTSTQAFFAPDPEDADLIRATLSATVRYGATTLDIPSLQCWLRARLEGQWQPPTLAQIEPLVRADPERVQRVIREAIRAHPDDYADADSWQKNLVDAMLEILPEKVHGLLDELLTPRPRKSDAQEGDGKKMQVREELEKLGW